MAGQSIRYIGRDFDGVFKNILYLLKFDPSHGKSEVDSIRIRKSWFRFRANKRIPSTALGPVLIQVFGKRSKFWLPCVAPDDVYGFNKRWALPIYVNGQGQRIDPASGPTVIRDLPQAPTVT